MKRGMKGAFWRKVLIVNYEMSYTGSPRAAYNMAVVLKELGYEPYVWTMNTGPFEIEFERLGIAVEKINFPEDTDVLGKKLQMFRFVICNTIFCAAFASYAKNFSETVLYIMEAANIPQLIHDCCLNEEDIVHARHLACVSEYARDFIRNQYGIQKIAILRNYVRTWSDMDKAPGLNKVCEPVKFLVSGTIEYRKGQDIAEEAFLLLPDEYKSRAELHFVGSVPDWTIDFCEKLKEKRHPNIYFHDVIQEENKLFDFYQSMDVVMVTSRDESCSLVALEGAMLGKALIVTENTGAKYVVDDAFILPTGNSVALNKKMMELIDNHQIITEQGKANYKRYLKYGNKRRLKKELGLYLFKMQVFGTVRKICRR